jgi:TonB family protein
MTETGIARLFGRRSAPVDAATLSPERTWLWRSVARSARFFEAQRPATQRGLIVGAVILVHMGLIAILTAGLSPIRPKLEREVDIALVGGPFAVVSETPRPVKLLDPQVAIALPPEIDIAEPTTLVAQHTPAPAGSPNVSGPAMAIAEAHAFPPPRSRQDIGAQLRLLLFIAADGSVADAQVFQTSGAAMLDQMAIAWVKSHWRYLPAMRNGIAIADSTIAVVAFSSRPDQMF